MISTKSINKLPMQYSRSVFPSDVSPMELHASMFLPTIQKLGTPQQQETWLFKAMTAQVLGTYAQTELGHGKTAD